MNSTILCLLFISLLCSACSTNWQHVYEADSGIEKHQLIDQLSQQGNAHAQYVLSQHYLRGEYVKSDLQKAELWLQASAKNGYSESQYALALRYNTQHDESELDHTRAVYWLKLAAEQGHLNAQYELGEHYHYGIGIQQDSILSYLWLSLASRHNSFVAIRARSLLLDKMNAEQLSQAQQALSGYYNQYAKPFD